MVSRRTLINTGLLVPLATFGVRAQRGVAIAQRLRPALNVFSFLELLNAHLRDANQGLSLFDVCNFAASQGFEAVDLTGYFFPGYPAAPSNDYLVRLKRHIFDLGLEISGTGVRNDFTAADSAIRREGIERIKTWIDVAARLGAPVIRAFADSQPPFKNWREAANNAPRAQVEEWLADALRECAVYGGERGIIVGVQNHGDFINTGTEHLSLIKRVDHDWCKPLVDTGKYLTADPYADIALTAPLAVNWQIKETLGSTMDSPRVDMIKLVKIIKASGYRGYLPIETLAMGRKDYDPRAEVRRLHEQLQAALIH